MNSYALILCCNDLSWRSLDVTGGDVRRVQKLSRHSNLNTLMIYDDNRRNAQGEITDLLDGLV